MQTFRIAAVWVLAGSLIGCSSSSKSDGGTQTPTTPVSLSVPAVQQTQTVQIPPSGPVTGTVTLPPVSTVAGATGDLTVAFLSGSNVAFARTAPQQPQSSVRQRSSDVTLPGGPYIFEMTITAAFGFTLATVPGFTLNLGTLDTAGPDATYVLVVENGGTIPYQFLSTTVNNVLTFPTPPPAFTVAAGGVITFGIALASDVAPAPSITSFVATPTSLPVDGGSVTLAWNVTGATALSIDNGVGPVTPLTTGTIIPPNLTDGTTYTLTATNANAITNASAVVCVASGAVTAAITTSPTSYTQCTQSFLTTIEMTNGSCQTVTTSIIGFVSTVSGVGTCGFNGPEAYSSANDSNLPVSVAAGATATVFDLTNGNIGCCPTDAGCSIDCNDTLEWTLMTNIGPVSAIAPPFTVVVNSCTNLPLCQ
jgi:hypothetical protein